MITRRKTSNVQGKKKVRAGMLLLGAQLLGICLLSGCSITENSGMKLRDLEFTVVSDERLPEELKNLIEERKTAEFKFTYSDQESLYICIGYGEQSTGGYSIAVNELYLTDNAILVDTNLLGPPAAEKENPAVSYPYIVIKTEFLDKNVVFE